MSSSIRLAPKVELAGDVTVMTLRRGRREEGPNRITTDLEPQIVSRKHEERRRLLLDFTNVEEISSLDLGTLVTLHKTIKASGGQLTLFNLDDPIYEVFTVTRLHTLLQICREESASNQPY